MAAHTCVNCETFPCREVIDLIVEERRRQHTRWGVQSLPDGTGKPVDQDAADFFKSITDYAAATGKVTWRDVLTEEVAEAYAETDPERLVAELVQVAAVAVSWAEDIRRREL